MKKIALLVLLAIGWNAETIAAAEYGINKTDAAAVTSSTQTAVVWPDYQKCEITNGGDYEVLVAFERGVVDNYLTGAVLNLGNFATYTCFEADNGKLEVSEAMVLGNKPAIRELWKESKTESNIWKLLDVQFLVKGKWTSIGLKRRPRLWFSLRNPKKYLRTGVLDGVIAHADAADDGPEVKVILKNLEKRP